MKKLFNPKKPLLWIIIGLVAAALVIAILVINHLNSVSIGIIGGADGPTSIIVSSSNDNPAFQATVIEINGDTALVEPAPDSDAARSADKIQLSLTSVEDETRERLKVGTEIIVEYDGTLQETYPAMVGTLYHIHIAE